MSLNKYKKNSLTQSASFFYVYMFFMFNVDVLILNYKLLIINS